MNNLVIIPTAGIGSRMKGYTKNLNKALLPYKSKPILSHIIDYFPKDTRFIIPLGYQSDQIKNFCNLVYQDRNITFLEVDWQSSKAGTGYTLKMCKEFVNQPFWYVPCDTFIDELFIDKVDSDDYFFVKKVDDNLTSLYTMFQTNDGIITDISFKKVQDSNWSAFTGLMYIFNYKEFFTNLESISSNEFIPVIKKGSKTLELNSWLDFGNLEIYQQEINKIQKFDFSKTDEVTYLVDGKLVKWWKDKSIAEKKFIKTIGHSSIFPNNLNYLENFLVYDIFPGQTLYQKNDSLIFKKLLNWLYEEVWKKSSILIYENSLEFYKEKTLSRVTKFLEKYPDLKKVNFVDGVPVKNYQHYLNNIDWEYLSKNSIACFTHGDLQFDNLIVNNNDEFKIIDWRHEFAGLINCGDLYYDLAKLAGGFIINYAAIKENNFKYQQIDDQVFLGIPNIDNFEYYEKELRKFVLEKNLDYKKVQLLIPIIFWNMSPLHSKPFDLFLWYLGLKLFSKIYE